MPQVYPSFPEYIPHDEHCFGHYIVKFAHNSEELNDILKLRYEVFNLEMGEGLESSSMNQRDEDEFDANCHHLLICDKKSKKAIGTYRMQIQDMARDGKGFYSGTEYDLSDIPENVIKNAVEIGRACIAKEHRNGRILFLLWRGLAYYMKHNNSRYLFGCCSINSQVPEEGLVTYELLRKQGQLHPTISVRPKPGYECVLSENEIRTFPEPQIPQLMRIYLNYKAKICGMPAIDRAFKTIDFLTLVDIKDFDETTYKKFFT